MDKEVVLVTMGSLGDIYPFVAIGVALKKRGYPVTIVCNAPFDTFAKEAGLNVISYNLTKESRTFFELIDWEKPFYAFMQSLRILNQKTREIYNILSTNFDPARTILLASSAILAARILQEKKRFLFIGIYLSPTNLWSTEEPIKTPGFPYFAKMPYSIRKIAAKIFSKGIDWFLKPWNQFRRELGLPQVKNIMEAGTLSLQQNIALFPSWFLKIPSDWPKRIKCTGFLRLKKESERPLSNELLKFFEGVNPPIIFTCGTPVNKSENFFKVATRVINKLGLRALFITLHSGDQRQDLPKHIMCVSYASFAEIFPRAALIVHHGGIGTTAEAFASGTPQLIVPKVFDQFDNAYYVEKLGCGLALVGKAYTAKNLEDKIRYLLNAKEIRDNCKKIAKQMDFDGALEQTCQLIEAEAKLFFMTP